ncbi:MAG TPA: hypothetical protein PLF59_08185 [Cyclobacteriaceae bacterium]|nr:hypothetical protein [Cyclobacteriaceae bacterium]
MKTVVESYPEKEIKACNIFGELLVKSAKSKIGHLQEGRGPFESWPPLAESTIADKVNKGYAFNSEYNPLLRTGEMRDSITYKFYPTVKKVVLGSDDIVMLYQEEGTFMNGKVHIPPRSVIGLTMFQAKEIACMIFGKFLQQWISGQPIRMSVRLTNYV